MKKLSLAVFFLFTLVLSGCTTPWSKKALTPQKVETGTEPVLKSGEPKQFNNLEELKSFLARQTSQGVGMGGGLARESLSMTKAMDSAAPTAGIANQESATGNDYSKTNNQVTGVDEADIVKTDGQYIYYAVDSKVYIVSAASATEATVIAEIKPGDSVRELFISNNRLAVFGNDYNFSIQGPEKEAAASVEATGGQASPGNAGADSSVVSSVEPDTMMVERKMIAPGIMPPIYNQNFSFLKVYDLADKKAPKLVRDFHFEGDYSNARLIDGFVYFVTNNYSYNRPASPLPRIYSDQQELFTDKMLPVYYFDFPYQSYSFTNVSSLSLLDDKAELNSEAYLLSGQEQLYASAKNIYLTHTNYLDEQELIIAKTRTIITDRLSEKEKNQIAAIEAIDEEILSKPEKAQKINSILARVISLLNPDEQKQLEIRIKNEIKADHPKLQDELETTSVYKISVDKGMFKYLGKAEVPGRVLNQFSMDEQGDFFRIATTKERTWSMILSEEEGKSSSGVYVIDSSLAIVGRVADLAPGERIYSARFMGDRAYLVTFEQTDPLFVVNLKEPAAPRLLGELKVPGFSNYLHPIGDNILLGLGRDVETNQWGGVVPTSLKLALFDVTDPAQPKELAVETLGNKGSDSAALYDHKAFMYDNDRKLLIIPATLTDRATDEFAWGKISFNGVLVFDLKDNAIKLRGKIDHWVKGSGENYFDYQRAVRRSVRIDNNLFSLSNSQIKINDLATLSLIKEVTLTKEADVIIKPMPLLR